MPPEVETDETLTVVVDEDENTEDTEAAAGDATEGSEEQSDPQLERVAAMMGWKPRDKFKGPADKWRPADEFVANFADAFRGERQKNQKLESQMNRIVAQLAKLTDAQKRQMDAAAEQALAQAIEAGDVESAKKILQDAKAQAQPDEHPAFTEFKSRNDWFDVDDEATAYAIAMDARLAKSGPITDPDAHFRKIETAVRKRFPELFGESANDDGRSGKGETKERQQRAAPLVARGSRTADRQRTGELTVADLPPDHRKAAAECGVPLESYVRELNKIRQRERAA